MNIFRTAVEKSIFHLLLLLLAVLSTQGLQVSYGFISNKLRSTTGLLNSDMYHMGPLMFLALSNSTNLSYHQREECILQKIFIMALGLKPRCEEICKKMNLVICSFK